jgi:hypothetical protein
MPGQFIYLMNSFSPVNQHIMSNTDLVRSSNLLLSSGNVQFALALIDPAIEWHECPLYTTVEFGKYIKNERFTSLKLLPNPIAGYYRL